jgi:hypothetical protein
VKRAKSRRLFGFRGTLISIVFFASVGQAQADVSASSGAAVTVLPQADLEFKQWKEHDFLAFDPHYKEELTNRIARARALGKQVISREVAGQNTELSHQILAEIIWLISSTADFTRMDQRLDALQATLDHPDREAQAEKENPGDGSWGQGYTEWFFKVIASYTHFDETNSEFHFIDRINSPQKLTDYLVSVSVSDISRTGVDHEREFNESLSYLMRMILRHKPKQYAYDPRLKATLMDLILHRFRNPMTGYWGESYVRDGHLYFVDDLSMTFHVVSYLDGNVPDMNKVVATTLAAQNAEFPVGCLYEGQHYDHLNMDVAELFRLGWPHASEAQKKAIALDLHELLHWCLTESLQPDGSFKMWVGDNSKEESTYYGASFLSRIGYFNKSKRFWTDEDFPEADNVRQKIIAYIEKHLKSGATGGEYYRSALEQLDYKR